MNLALVSTLLGGVGLFILGMILITEGLKSIGGDTLRKTLARFTGGRVTSVLSGAGITAMVQSSHATIIATIGFVSAGLITFRQSLGLILGANLGTTSTGWIVSVIGLKLKIGLTALPFVGVGALMRLLGRDRVAGAGQVVAGFGLIFVGIGILQDGMRNLSSMIDLTRYDGGTVGARLLLVGIGVAMTVVMQTSSAAMAATMAALSVGSIDLLQAAALVIGQNIGTTLTAAIVAVGATTPARRTAAAHILFNVMIGVMAFAVLPHFVALVHVIAHFFGVRDDAIALAGFHSAINLMGIFILLPFLGPVARVLARLVPEKGPRLTRHLDDSVLGVPTVAVETVRRSVIDITIAAIDIIRDMIVSEKSPSAFMGRLREVGDALDVTRAFLSRIKTNKGASHRYAELFLDVMHAVDHVDQLIIASREFGTLSDMRGDRRLNLVAMTLADYSGPVLERLEGLKNGESLRAMEEASRYMKRLREQQRKEILDMTSRGELEAETALRQIEAIRWLERVTYRIFRTLYYLGHHGGNGELEGWNDAHGAKGGAE